MRLGIIARGVKPDLEDYEARTFHLSPGTARSFAAVLIRAADQLEMLTADVNTAKQDREG